ncbi:MAG: porin [Gammaproteobacteria bacterium]
MIRVLIVAVLVTVATSATGQSDPALRGRVMVEAWGTSDDYPTGTEVRAARIGVTGAVAPTLSYKLEADFAGDRATIKDAYLQFAGWERATVTVGNLKPAFSLENLIGLPKATFLERASPNVFAFSETLGAAIATGGDGWSLGATLFGETPGTVVDGNEGIGLAARTTFAPVRDDSNLIHFGVSGFYKRLGDQALRVRQRPEARIFSTRLVDTGALDADANASFGVEFAAVQGPLSLQAEYIQSRVDLTAGDASFDGAYVFASWFLTGERRPYTTRNGTFGNVKPAQAIDDGGRGAFELALRYSTLDLDDGAVAGGVQDNVTLGLNWYATDAVRFTANWVYFDVEGATAVSPYGLGDHNGHALGLRAQVVW